MLYDEIKAGKHGDSRSRFSILLQPTDPTEGCRQLIHGFWKLTKHCEYDYVNLDNSCVHNRLRELHFAIIMHRIAFESSIFLQVDFQVGKAKKLQETPG